jgi:hypothetical protein
MPEFVILQHQLPSGNERGSHWDFMLQVDDHLRTWALADPPANETTVDAMLLDDHRLDYLNYEGPVSGNRGAVSQWDRGSYTLLTNEPQHWQVELRGKRLVGRASLRRVEDQRWLFSFVGVIEAT